MVNGQCKGQCKIRGHTEIISGLGFDSALIHAPVQRKTHLISNNHDKFYI